MSRREELIEQYRQIHSSKQYGRNSELLTGYIHRHVLGRLEVRTILDFGCGQSRLVDWLAKLSDAKGFRYDPAIPDWSTMPVTSADLVICTDVMEHIPEDDVDDVLTQIRSISRHAYFNIALAMAGEVLPNGENAHCTVRPDKWWQEKLSKHFNLVRKVDVALRQRAAFVTWPAKPRQ